MQAGSVVIHSPGREQALLRWEERQEQGWQGQGWQESQVLCSEALYSWQDGGEEVTYGLMGKGGASFVGGGEHGEGA